MPAIWSSSERPISVRTVWVDGIRHAILSPDDPLIDFTSRRLSRVSRRSKSYSPKYQPLETRLDPLDGCFTNSRMIVGHDRSESKAVPKVYRKVSAPACPRMYSNTSDTNTLESILPGNRKTPRKNQICKSLKDTEMDACSAPDKTADKNVCERNSVIASEPELKLSETDCQRTKELSDTFWNPLFERVLQWLDLSGRTRSYDTEKDFARKARMSEEQRKWNRAKRRLPRPRRDRFEETEPTMEQKEKLQKDRLASCLKREECKALQRPLPKIRNARERIRVDDETPIPPLPDELNSTKLSQRVERTGAKIDTKEKASATSWSSPGKLKLRVVIPNIVCRESCASSQESLIND